MLKRRPSPNPETQAFSRGFGSINSIIIAQQTLRICFCLLIVLILPFTKSTNLSIADLLCNFQRKLLAGVPPPMDRIEILFPGAFVRKSTGFVLPSYALLLHSLYIQPGLKNLHPS
jgi:hypothetical protein